MVQQLVFAIVVVLVGFFLLISAVWRIRKKLVDESNPSLWTYINELGGYIVVGFLLTIGGIIWTIVRLTGQ
jgi:hypothetical protein